MFSVQSKLLHGDEMFQTESILVKRTFVELHFDYLQVDKVK